MEAMSLLKKDHETVKKLFDAFEDSESTSEKKSIVADACMELNSVDAWRDLIALAQKKVLEGRPEETARMRTRLFMEAPPR